MTDLSKEIDITTDGEYGDYGDVKIVMSRDQFRALVNTINWNVDLDTVRYDNEEPERADFLDTFVNLGLEKTGH